MIKFHELTKSFGDEIIFENLSFELPNSGVVSIFGPSGSGKSTAVNLILGLEKPDKGSVEGTSNLKFSVVFQEDRLLEWLDLKSNVLAVNDDENICAELLKETGLIDSADKYPSELSGGMRQRVALARALAYDGDIFIFDEAFKALDYELKKSLITLVKKYIKNKLCIFISHDIKEIAELSDYVYILGKKPISKIKVIDLKNSKSVDEKLLKLKNEI